MDDEGSEAPSLAPRNLFSYSSERAKVPKSPAKRKKAACPPDGRDDEDEESEIREDEDDDDDDDDESGSGHSHTGIKNRMIGSLSGPRSMVSRESLRWECPTPSASMSLSNLSWKWGANLDKIDFSGCV